MPAAKKNADPSVIDWLARESKRNNDSVIRNHMFPMLYGPRDNFNVLSMPGANWYWEEIIAKDFSRKFFEFYGVDHDPKVRVKMAEHADKLNTSKLYLNAFFHPLPMQSWETTLRTTGHKYDIIYADYMGTWCRTKRKEIELLFERRLLNFQGYLILTSALTRTGDRLSKEEAIEIGRGERDIYVSDDRLEYKETGKSKAKPETIMACRGIPKIVQDIAKSHGAELHVLPPHLYYNTYANNFKVSPQVSLCFRRIA